MREVWRAVIGFEGYYEVSNLGNVRSLDRVVVLANGNTRNFKGKVLSPALSSGRYPSVLLSGERIKRTCYVHRLVVEAFIRELSEDDTVDHINRITTDNRLDNLRIATRIEQAANKSTKQTSSAEFFGVELVYSDGTVQKYDETFCLRNSLKKGDVLRVLRGDRGSCGGWRLRSNKID